jgi:GDP-L-fucose synthase
MKILVTGGTGMVGSAFKAIKTKHELILVGSQDCNLLNSSDVLKMFNYHQPDAVIHLAAKVGGVKGNSEFVSDYFCQNILMNTHVLNSAKITNTSKVLSLLSTCIYPNNPDYPLTEDQIHNGEPHHSNFGYAYAKRMLEVHSRAIRQQYGYNYITAVPNNIYGINDNFDLENGHVIPAIIRKIWEAKITNTVPVFWGTGRPLREFTYSQDIAKSLMVLIDDNYDSHEPINIGNTAEFSIKEVVNKICNVLSYHGEVTWDESKPEGQFKKPSSNKKFLKLFPNTEYTNLDEGLEKTCKWFVSNYPKIRGY